MVFKNPEVLAPAGELEQLKIAVLYGADAVYLAAQDFGMRAAPANFTFEQLKEGVDFAHKNNVKVFQTVNVLPTNSEVAHLEDFLNKSAECGVDAFIVSDIGVLMTAHRLHPEIDIHISVQAGVVNYLTANELYKLGAKRVVLARELTIEDIKEISDNTPEDLEIECFVHGAICMSFSGRCLISQYFVGRDANHGECAQPCRWEYEIRDPRRPNIALDVFENQETDKNGNIISKGSYILNSKDLCLIEHVDELIEAGITSFKIEGRAKSSFYVANTVMCYRAAVDSYLDNFDSQLIQNSSKSPNSSSKLDGDSWEIPAWIRDEVQKISHREYTTGFYFSAAQGEARKNGAYDPSQAPVSLTDKGYKQEYKPLAVFFEDGWHQRGKFFVGDEMDLLTPKKDLPPIRVKIVEIKDEFDNIQKNTAHADQILKFKIENAQSGEPVVDVQLGSFLRGKI